MESMYIHATINLYYPRWEDSSLLDVLDCPYRWHSTAVNHFHHALRYHHVTRLLMQNSPSFFTAGFLFSCLGHCMIHCLEMYSAWELLRMYCIDPSALVCIFNGGSSYRFRAIPFEIMTATYTLKTYPNPKFVFFWV